MTLFKHELRRGLGALSIWSGTIALLMIVCLALFPQMRGQMDQVSALFSSMGSFTAAFGMDRLNFGELMGFYGVECGNVLGLGGAFFAALIAVSALAGEERERTAEFLLTHPVRRSRVVAEKLLSVAAQVTALNAVAVVTALACFAAIGEAPDWRAFWLMHGAYLAMQLQIAALCFGASAFLRRGGLGIGLGLAAALYFLNLVANIAPSASWLKYVTPFAYADAADIVFRGRVDGGLLALGGLYAAAAVALAFWRYATKDIHA
ncbi:MAG: ABC transporter permease subunit [Christensenellales bacterium]|jgi:ABC-2 type transport system permease protein